VPMHVYEERGGKAPRFLISIIDIGLPDVLASHSLYFLPENSVHSLRDCLGPRADLQEMEK
jgi:hypothetical protein